MPDAGVTFPVFRAQASELLRRTVAGAGGLGGFVVLSLGDTSSQLITGAPRWLMALFVTLVVLAGFLLAKSYIALSNVSHILADVDSDQNESRLELPSVKGAFRALKKPDYYLSEIRVRAATEYRIGRLFYSSTIWVGVVAAALYLVVVWYASAVAAATTPP